MRVTQRMRTENAIRHMEENSQKLQTLEERIASNKQFQSVSDNPSGATAALTLRSSLEANKAYLETANVIGDWYSANELALKQLVDLATRAINLTLSGVSDSQGTAERAALAEEVNELLHQAVDVGNASHQNNYIFNGYKTTIKPFTPVDGDADPLYDSVEYYDQVNRTAPEVILRNVGPGQNMPQNIDGNAVLSPLFAALISARDALLDNASPDYQAGLQTALGELQTALDTVSRERTINGARKRQVDQMGERFEKVQIELKSLLSLKEDVNMAEAISTLRYQETVYQSVLEVGHRAISALSLFDMLS